MKKFLAWFFLFFFFTTSVLAVPNIIPVKQDNGSSTQNSNVAQVNGTTTSVNNGTVDNGTQRVTIASDSTGKVAATQSGNWSVRAQDGSGNAITSTSNALDVNIKSGSSAGTQYTDAASTVAHPVGTMPVFDNGGTIASISATTGLPVNCVTGCSSSGGSSSADGAAFTASTTSGTTAMGFYHSTIDTVADGKTAALAMDSKRNAFHVIRDAAGNARGANVNASNQLSVSVDNTVTVGSHAVTNAGTFAVQAAEADGANVTLGAKADAKSTATDTTAVTAMQVLKEISAMEQAPASRAVTNAGTFAVQATLQAASGVDIGKLTANQSVNVAQINGVTTLMGNGVTGTGSQRVTVASDNTPFAVKTDQTTHGTTDLVAADITKINGTANVPSPCTYLDQTTVAISQTASTKLISQTSAKTNYICGGTIVVGAAEIVNIVEGTGSTCGTSTAAAVGSTTAANGMSFAANGGFTINQPIKGTGTNLDLCLTQSGSNRVSGYITYVQK